MGVMVKEYSWFHAKCGIDGYNTKWGTDGYNTKWGTDGCNAKWGTDGCNVKWGTYECCTKRVMVVAMLKGCQMTVFSMIIKKWCESLWMLLCCQHCMG